MNIYALATSDGIDLQFTPTKIKHRLFLKSIIIFDVPENTIIKYVVFNDQYIQINVASEKATQFKIKLKL